MSTLDLPGFSDVLDAQSKLSGMSIRTPLLENVELNRVTGGRIFLKSEILQHTGSFKFRGAYNFICRLDERQKKQGLVAYSSGNHAQGVAYSAKLLGAKATIIMPSDAPDIKINNTRDFGADVVLYDRFSEDREAIGDKIIQENGALLIPPYDHPYIIAGQGTCGLEIVEQAKERNVILDATVICCGGGGLTSGSSIAIKELSPSTLIYSAEPADFDDTARSLVMGQRVSVSPDARSICDAVLTPTPGELTFSLNRTFVEKGLVVTDEEVRRAVKFAFNTLKLVVEPGGAVALAAVLHNKIDTKKKAIALTLSGGNVDPSVFKECLDVS
ncbi:pyridoxal-5'-phosphate-dependent protein [Rhodospirillales bacterium 47_12_T64]|nr:pyridoxal-5'-phosphate-dependent protein [Rhodospirillales bacterium 47_12_T64]